MKAHRLTKGKWVGDDEWLNLIGEVVAIRFHDNGRGSPKLLQKTYTTAIGRLERVTSSFATLSLGHLSAGWVNVPTEYVVGVKKVSQDKVMVLPNLT